MFVIWEAKIIHLSKAYGKTSYNKRMIYVIVSGVLSENINSYGELNRPGQNVFFSGNITFVLRHGDN